MKLILIRGIPGSGKSTLACQLYNADPDECVHFEADMFFMKQGKYEFDRNQIAQAHDWCQAQTTMSLANDKTVIVSNTFTTIKELLPYFQIAKSWNMTPVVYTCHNDWGNIHNVPFETIIAMKQRFEHNISVLF